MAFQGSIDHRVCGMSGSKRRRKKLFSSYRWLYAGIKAVGGSAVQPMTSSFGVTRLPTHRIIALLNNAIIRLWISLSVSILHWKPTNILMSPLILRSLLMGCDRWRLAQAMQHTINPVAAIPVMACVLNWAMNETKASLDVSLFDLLVSIVTIRFAAQTNWE